MSFKPVSLFVSPEEINALWTRTNTASYVSISSSTLKALLSDLASLKLRAFSIDKALSDLLPGVEPKNYADAVSQIMLEIDRAVSVDRFTVIDPTSGETFDVRYNGEQWEKVVGDG